MFVNYVNEKNDTKEVGILVSESEDHTQGTLVVFSANGASRIENYVPKKGQHFQDENGKGTYFEEVNATTDTDE